MFEEHKAGDSLLAFLMGVSAFEQALGDILTAATNVQYLKILDIHSSRGKRRFLIN